MRIRILCSIFLIVASTIAACGSGSDAATKTAPETENGSAQVAEKAVDPIAESAPADDAELASEFTMTSLAGEEVALSSLRGRYVLINFWATWCAPCREEMPYLQQLSIDHADRLTVLGVNMREEPERIYPFVEEFGLTFPVLLNPPDNIIGENNVRGLPVSYVVGPDGTVVYRKIGEMLPEEFDPWLAENLAL